MADYQDSEPDNYPKLSLPFERMQTEYDVVVVGSGYGAAVAASRMARAGKTVAILELGWEKRPGSFPHTLPQCLGQLSISGSSRKDRFLRKWPFPKDPTRLFRLILGEGQHAFVAHALGGGSLINAGVFLEADEDTLRMSPWPSEIRDNPADLRMYYERAATMLQPSSYPEDYPCLTKLESLKEQSELMGKSHTFRRPPLTIFFQNGRNNVGVPMKANTGSGHECTGLNDGSKNSLPTTYLADAWNWGAEIFCGCEVRYIEDATDDGGYVIYFAYHAPGRAAFEDHFKDQLFWVKAREWCFLGAGALGTTEILLRSRNHGLPLSPLVGRNMSGNGDMLIFGYNGSSDINGISGGDASTAARPGPTITAMIDNRRDKGSRDPLAGYIIQDGCIPEPFAPVIQAMLTLQTFRKEMVSSFWNPRQQIVKALAALKSIALGPYISGGAIQRTSTYLAMSHDTNEMTLTLKGDKPQFRGPPASSSIMVQRIKTSLEKVFRRTSASMGYSYFYGRAGEEVSVHLLGGANMSRNGTGRGGVTNHQGEVYVGTSSEVHSGLVCCDASVIPTALGVNPHATITALAERSLALLVDKSQLSIDMAANGDLSKDSVPERSQINPVQESEAARNHAPFISFGWQFTEVLEGYLSGQPNAADFETSEARGKGSSSAMQMFLTVEIGRRPKCAQYEGKCAGTVSCPLLSRSPLKVVDGVVEFFVKAQDLADSTSMAYSMRLVSLEGREYSLTARKQIDSQTLFSFRNMWKATTSVNFLVTQPDGTHIATGIARISIPSFYKQMKSFRRVDASPILRATLLLLIFLSYFMLRLCVAFFRPVVSSLVFRRSRAGLLKPPTRPTTRSGITARDGVKAILESYDPVEIHHTGAHQEACPVPILFLPGITGIGAAHHIFTLPFQRQNMVDYFTNRGYRCYVLNPRWSCEAHVAEECTVFDARLDIAAAVEHINRLEARAPYVVAHCQGSVALSIGLLDGVIEPSQIAGVTANSVFMNQVFGYWNSFKGASPLLIRLYEFLGGRYFPIARTYESSFFQKLIDCALRLYPVPGRRDVCTSVACHRSSFAFGLLWNHENLDAHIHDNVDSFFDGTHTNVLEHITRMGTRGQCLDNQLKPLLTPGNLLRLKGLPILWVSGTDNEVFNPESTLRDYELFRAQFGEALYQRFLVEGYGHLDPIVGKAAAEDVYWRVLEHVEWCAANHAGY